MKLNTKITIEVKWDEKEQLNKTSVNFDPNLTLNEVFVSIEMGNKSLRELLFSHVKDESQLEKFLNKQVKYIE